MHYSKLQDDLDALMRTEHGRRFIYHVLEDSAVEESRFSPSPEWTSYLAGKAEIGSSILKELRGLTDGLELEHMMRKEARSPTVEDKMQPTKVSDDIDNNFKFTY